MGNKIIIESKLKESKLELGCYDSNIEKISKKELNKVLDMVDYGPCDVEVSIRNKKHIVEIFHVDNEVDLNLTTPQEYQNTYGDNK